MSVPALPVGGGTVTTALVELEGLVDRGFIAEVKRTTLASRPSGAVAIVLWKNCRRLNCAVPRALADGPPLRDGVVESTLTPLPDHHETAGARSSGPTGCSGRATASAASATAIGGCRDAGSSGSAACSPFAPCRATYRGNPHATTAAACSGAGDSASPAASRREPGGCPTRTAGRAAATGGGGVHDRTVCPP